MEDMFPSAEGDLHARPRRREETGPRAGADRAHLDGDRDPGAASSSTIDEDDLQLLRYFAAVLQAGFPLVALLQLARVYGQALAQIADAEVASSTSTCTSR